MHITEISGENFSLTNLVHKMRETKTNIHTNQKCINKTQHMWKIMLVINQIDITAYK